MWRWLEKRHRIAYTTLSRTHGLVIKNSYHELCEGDWKRGSGLRRICMCDVTDSYLWHDSCMCEPWRHEQYSRTVWRWLTKRLGIAVHSYKWLTRSSVWHDSFISVTWLAHLCETWLIYTCAMTTRTLTTNCVKVTGKKAQDRVTHHLYSVRILCVSLTHIHTHTHTPPVLGENTMCLSHAYAHTYTPVFGETTHRLFLSLAHSLSYTQRHKYTHTHKHTHRLD